MDFADDKQPFRATAGPTLRMILDFSDLSKSRFLMAPGVSGNPMSSHYGDLMRSWRDFRWMDFSRARIAHALTLAPAAGSP